MAVGAVVLLPEPGGPVAAGVSARFDLVGMGTFVVGIAGVQYAALQSQELGWTATPVLLAGVPGSPRWRRSSRWSATVDGFVDLRLFRSRTFAGAAVTMALACAAYFGILVFLSLFLQSTQHYSALETGLVYVPTILPFMLISPLAVDCSSGGRVRRSRPLAAS